MKTQKLRRFKSLRPGLSALAAVSLASALTRPAMAMPTYPDGIQFHLGLDYTPQCTLCHATPTGGGAIVSKFGQSMQAVGLTADFSTLYPALATLEANRTDSNKDGVPDIEQLKEGSDPNSGATVSAIPEQKFGCGARVARGELHSDAALALGVLLACGIGADRRRRSKR